MSNNKKSYDDGSIVDLAIKGLNPIKELLEDGKPISKLLPINIHTVLSLSFLLLDEVRVMQKQIFLFIG